MFSGHKGLNALNLFNWKQQGESSLTTGLLYEVPPEIELSDYRRAPSSGSESPSGLLNGEGLKVEPIADLDLFFERIYSYYCEKGLWCIIIKWIFELLSVAFTICFSAFFILFVDWNGLHNAKCGMDAVESGIKPCDLSKEAIHEHPLVPFTLTKTIIVAYLGIFSLYCFFCFLRFFSQLKNILKIRDFYHNSLHVSDNEIQTLPWALILEKVVQTQSSKQLCVVKELSVHDVVMRLMRKENYMIGMINKGILAFPISSWVPGAGPTVKVGTDGVQYRLILTKTLQWTLDWCILQNMFDGNFHIRSEFISDPKTLEKRLKIVGFVMLLLSPFLVIFMLVYLFLRHAEQFYNHPSSASSRRWSNLSKWIFREFNEVDHFFKHRINNSVVHASEYLKQFPSPMITVVAKFISFVSGGFAAILIIIGFLEESLLEGHVFGRNLFWYAAVFGTITAISRAAMTDELLVLDPAGKMSLAVEHTHYMPKRWRGKENTEAVRMELETLFQYTGMMLLEEMASIFITPYLLMFVVPKRVDDILQFIADFTEDVEGVGHVCSFSVFDFQYHGNGRYGSPFNSHHLQRSSQGKMEKSFLSFQSSYPSWEPNTRGKQFLQNLEKFTEQTLQVQASRPTYVSSRMPQRSPSHRALSDGNGLIYRDTPSNNIRAGYEFSPVWPRDIERKDFPYILDCYYTSQCQQAVSDLRVSLSSRPGVIKDGFKDIWTSPDLTQNTGTRDWWIRDEAKYDELQGSFFQERQLSPLEASTSAPLYGESVLRHNDLNDGGIPSTSGQWWRRMGPQGANPQASFLEHPNFNGEESYHNDDNPSDSSVGEPEHLGWNHCKLSRTFTVDDDGEFNLPFDDIYGRQSESPEEDWDPADIV